jgi:hypothetical protein
MWETLRCWEGEIPPFFRRWPGLPARSCDKVSEQVKSLESLETIRIINPVRTSQETHYVSITRPNRLMLFRETVAVYCENHTEHTDTLCGQNAEFYKAVSTLASRGSNRAQSRGHVITFHAACSYVCQLWTCSMLAIGFGSKLGSLIWTQPNVKASGTYNYHCASNGK